MRVFTAGIHRLKNHQNGLLFPGIKGVLQPGNAELVLTESACTVLPVYTVRVLRIVIRQKKVTSRRYVRNSQAAFRRVVALSVPMCFSRTVADCPGGQVAKSGGDGDDLK